jgi:hypothetical protein
VVADMDTAYESTPPDGHIINLFTMVASLLAQPRDRATAAH